MAEGKPVIDLRVVTKTYGDGATAVHALDGVSLVVEPGDYVAIMGASGSGKSTLMNIVGCLDEPTSGSYRLDGVPVRALDERRLALVRNRKIGFVFQSFNLIARTPAIANVELPLAYARAPRGRRRAAALDALSKVGLADRAHHLPNQLSGGQQQRVAVARALDSTSSAGVLTLFDELAAAGRTVVMITHEADVAAHAKRIVRMRDGTIISDERTVALAAMPPCWQSAETVGAA